MRELFEHDLETLLRLKDEAYARGRHLLMLYYKARDQGAHYKERDPDPGDEDVLDETYGRKADDAFANALGKFKTTWGKIIQMSETGGGI